MHGQHHYKTSLPYPLTFFIFIDYLIFLSFTLFFQFMYTMPLSVLPDGTKRVFFEETSLVGRDSRRLTFAECKKRAYQRLKHLGTVQYSTVDQINKRTSLSLFLSIF